MGRSRFRRLVSLALVPTAILLTERDRRLLWLPVALGAGVALYFALPAEPAPWPGPVAGAGLLLGLLALRRRPAAVLTLVPLLALALGFSAAQLRTASIDVVPLAARTAPLLIQARIAVVEPGPVRSRLLLEEVQGPEGLESPLPARVRLRISGLAEGLTPGSRVRLRAVLMPPPQPVEPGAYDFQRDSYFKEIGAVGFALGQVEILGQAEPGGWREALRRIRHGVARAVNRALEPPEAGIAAALLTGQRSGIPEDTLAAIRDAGLAHLLAISGLHLGLVAGFVFFALRAALALVAPVALRFPIKKWAAVAALLAAGAYMLLAGATVPTQRAFVMVGLVLLAVLVDRTAISMRPVAFAALLILLLSPESLLGASFQMSFAAVVALVAGYEALRDRSRRDRVRSDVAFARLARGAVLYIGGVALTSVIAMAATAPFAAFHFNRLAGFGLVANVLAVPIAALWIMPWGLLAVVLMPLGLERLALAPMGWGIEAVVAIAETVAGWSGGVLLVPSFSPAALLLMVGGGLWLCLWRKPWRVAGIAPLAFGLLLAGQADRPDILVSGDARLVGIVTDGGGRALSTTRRARFEAEQWLRRDAAEEPAPWPEVGTGRVDGLACDALGCVYRGPARTAALVLDGRALAEDCASADLVLALMPVPRGRCRGAKVVDRFDLWRDGTHAVWLSENGIRIESVLSRQGDRPWVTKR
ncbi:MAG: DUF4131 domain-containing protein [Rhodospirillaceae bacterium]|nr:DUF4131 domain-containing protein [Rhodospirillaceae bacterium]